MPSVVGPSAVGTSLIVIAMKSFAGLGGLRKGFGWFVLLMSASPGGPEAAVEMRDDGG